MAISKPDENDRPSELKTDVDTYLRTRRHLDYWESTTWAHEASPVVDELAAEAAAHPSAELVSLLQRAASHLAKVLLRADDSNGEIGGLCYDVLALHRESCASGVANPVALARWMVKFAFEEQDFFEIDPVAYADALGEKGLATYRKEVAKRSTPAPTPTEAPARPALSTVVYGGFPSIAAKYAAERLAVLDRDLERVVEVSGGSLTHPSQFQAVAMAMVELGEVEQALEFARRGIAEHSGWQVAQLYDLAVELTAANGDPVSVVDLRREQHQRTPSFRTYAGLRDAADAIGTWTAEVGAARALLHASDVRELIEALLDDGDADEAWRVAASCQPEPRPAQWLRLAGFRELSHPSDALTVYLRLADDVLVEADQHAYSKGVRHLKLARGAASAARLTSEFEAHVTELREKYKRRPTLIAKLDRAGLS